MLTLLHTCAKPADSGILPLPPNTSCSGRMIPRAAPSARLMNTAHLHAQSRVVIATLQGQALALAGEKDPIAQRIGASNTLVRQPGGGWKALNTDWVGVTSALKLALGADSDANHKALLAGKTVLVVGCGGAGQAIAFASVECGAQKVG